MVELSKEDECVCKSLSRCSDTQSLGTQIGNVDLYKQKNKGSYKLWAICWNTPDVCGFLNLSNLSTKRSWQPSTPATTSLSPSPNIRWTHLDDLEAEVAFVQHDDLVLVRAVVDHVPQREQRVAAGQHRLAPGGVALVADDQAAAVVGDGLVQDGSLLRLLQAGEVVLEVAFFVFFFCSFCDTNMSLMAECEAWKM